MDLSNDYTLFLGKFLIKIDIIIYLVKSKPKLTV
jgi:hypothetical protein